MSQLVILIGCPASGKGLLREAAASIGFTTYGGSDFLDAHGDERIKKIMEAGELVPDHLCIPIFQKGLEHVPGFADILLDGVIRTLEQYEALMPDLEQSFDEIKVVHVELPIVEAKRRALARKRKDDQLQVAEVRFNEYSTKTVHVIERFKKNPRVRFYVVNNNGPREFAQGQFMEFMTSNHPGPVRSEVPRHDIAAEAHAS